MSFFILIGVVVVRFLDPSLVVPQGLFNCLFLRTQPSGIDASGSRTALGDITLSRLHHPLLTVSLSWTVAATYVLGLVPPLPYPSFDPFFCLDGRSIPPSLPFPRVPFIYLSFSLFTGRRC